MVTQRELRPRECYSKEDCCVWCWPCGAPAVDWHWLLTVLSGTGTYTTHLYITCCCRRIKCAG